jgi:hypothetical protein
MSLDGVGDNYDWALKYIVGPVKTCVEVGSRDLEDAIKISSSLDCTVLSFEPDSERFEYCKSKLLANTSIDVRRDALSYFNGTANFFIYSSGSSSMYKHRTDPVLREELVEVRRFDSLLLPPLIFSSSMLNLQNIRYCWDLAKCSRR